MKLKSGQLRESTKLANLSLSVFVLLLFYPLSAFHSLSYALDEGAATTGFEFRSLNLETSSTKTSQFEMAPHLDVWQDVPNVGKLILWLDWTIANNDEKMNRLGRGFLTLREFRFRDYILNGLIGDSSFAFSNLPEKFSNVTYPDIYSRGFQADFFSKWGEVHAYGGKVARLEGLLGSTYNITDETLYGFKGGVRPIPCLLLGTGFIRTQSEVDNNDNPVTRSNNIFLFDSDFEIAQWLKWLAEFRWSSYKGEPGVESRSDYLLRVGPILKTENLKLEANYRRIGTDYRAVNEATQGDRDQEGFFLLAEYKPWKELTLFGNGDRYTDNVSNKPDRNLTESTRGLLGLSFFSPKYPSFYVTFDVNDRKSRSDYPSPVDNLTSTLFSELRYQYKDFNPYARYRRIDYKDRVIAADEYSEDVITLGMRQNFTMGTLFYVEGESDQKKFQIGEKESRLSGKLGFNYTYSQKLSLWGEAIYSKLEERLEDTRTNRIEGSFGLSAELPWGIQIQGYIQYAKNLNPSNEILKSEGTQATLKAMKTFAWGERERIAGLKPGMDTKGYGIIEGIVFNDINRNGVQDRGEEGVKDVTVRLEDGSIAKTDEKGYYQFSRVEVGGHFMTLDVKKVPAEYSLISPDKARIQLRLRETLRVNFQLIAVGRIEGRVINDANSNGKSDPDEKGIPDVLILLEPGDNNAYTDEDGKFIFENILPGGYLMKLDRATLPEDSLATSPEELKFEVPVGGELKDMDFLIYVKPRPIIIGPPKK